MGLKVCNGQACGGMKSSGLGSSIGEQAIVSFCPTALVPRNEEAKVRPRDEEAKVSRKGGRR